DVEEPADDRHGASVADERPEERRRAVVDERDRDERQPETGRVREEQDRALADRRGRGCETQDPAEDHPDARSPSDREDRPETEAGEIGRASCRERVEMWV